MDKQHDPAGWPHARTGRTRVLVEHADESVGRSAVGALEAAGYEAMWCGGPDHLHRHRCPLVTGQGCALADDADVVVNALNTDVDDQRRVLEALREQHADLPVVVEIPAPRVAGRAELVEGCTVLFTPMTRSTLLDAVEQAGPEHDDS